MSIFDFTKRPALFSLYKEINFGVASQEFGNTPSIFTNLVLDCTFTTAKTMRGRMSPPCL